VCPAPPLPGTPASAWARRFAGRGRDHVLLDGRLEALAARERLGAVRRVQHVFAFIQHPPRDGDRMLERGQRANGASPKAAALHDRRIELQVAVAGQAATRGGVELRIVFQELDGALHGVERAATATEDDARGLGRGPTSGLAAGPGGLLDRARTAVYEHGAALGQA
jgi:hypothetical protein